MAGKTALITGGARGLGAAYVRALHAEGARVVPCVQCPTRRIRRVRRTGRAGAATR
ncbi:SDR family NAD(P)-dependent oxidoreductase [Microbacterium sp. MC2]